MLGQVEPVTDGRVPHTSLVFSGVAPSSQIGFLQISEKLEIHHTTELSC